MLKLGLFETVNERQKYGRKFALRNMCVGDDCQCVREKRIKSCGELIFFPSFLFHTVYDIRRKLYTVEIHLTVEKRAKRMPDPTVETT